MNDRREKPARGVRMMGGIALWKAFWLVFPLTYLAALAGIALTGVFLEWAPGRIQVSSGAIPVYEVTDEWLAWDGVHSMLAIALFVLHAAIGLAFVVANRNNTTRPWFTRFAVGAAIAYGIFALVFAVQRLLPVAALPAL